MDWNLVAECRPGYFWQMCSLLGPHGELEQTDHFNLVVSRVDSPREIPARLISNLRETQEDIYSVFARIVPADVAFQFADAKALRWQVTQAASKWSGNLEGHQLAVQVTRRRSTSSTDYESWLHVITDSLFDSFKSAKSIVPYAPGDEIPEYALVVESIADRLGMSLWTREEATRFPLLGSVRYPVL